MPTDRWAPAFAGEDERWERRAILSTSSRPGFVYIMASGRHRTLYIGSTDDLPKRAWEHRNKVAEGFTRRYGCTLLVWFERHDTLFAARSRERQMKEWKRAWKIARIEAMNPAWRDLAETLA